LVLCKTEERMKGRTSSWVRRVIWISTAMEIPKEEEERGLEGGEEKGEGSEDMDVYGEGGRRKKEEREEEGDR